MTSSKQKIFVVGGGQLVMMMAEEVKLLDLPFSISVIDPTPNCPAAYYAQHAVVGAYDDAQKIRVLAEEADIVTYEIELAGQEVLAALAATGKPVHPSPETLGIIRDKFVQKDFLRKAGLPVPDFWDVRDVIDARILLGDSRAGKIMLKARSGGYDGRGNRLVQDYADIDAAFESMGDRTIFAECYVDFSKEVSVIAARSTTGEIKTYPVGENIHKNNILYTTIVPARVATSLLLRAEGIAARSLEVLHGAGVFGIEMFIEGNKVFINEIAPRVHNSGHYTIEACIASQFENHLRAISGLPLGSTDFVPGISAAVMHNILGPHDFTGKYKFQGVDTAFTHGGYFHPYGKHESRADRKLGHVTTVGSSLDNVLKRAYRAREAITVRPA